LFAQAVNAWRSQFLQVEEGPPQDVDDYAADIEQNLADLHARVHSGAYRALPSRRAYIPKADGKRRTLGIPI
jgi:retron-type reverse transcriptase